MAEPGQDRQPAADPDFYRRLCESSGAALIATDAEFRVRFWNEAATALFGRTSEQMLGEPLSSIAPSNRQQLVERLLRRTVRYAEVQEFEVEHVGPEGKPLSLLAMFAPLPGPDDRPQGVVAWVRDVTQRRRMADRLAGTEKMASLGTLAGGVAHHFNNILGGVATFVDYALTTNDPSASRRALQMTAEAATRVAKITQSLLSFAEQDPGRMDLADLTEAVLTFAHLVERPLAERNILLNLDLHAVPVVAVEANRMHQVLGNLLTNAEEAMPHGGSVSLALTSDERWVYLDFADTGSGIAAEHLPLVFEPFFTTKGLVAGGDRVNPGLGLSVVHGIVTEMGGEITVTSEIDKGTRFRIRFPQRQRETP